MPVMESNTECFDHLLHKSLKFRVVFSSGFNLKTFVFESLKVPFFFFFFTELINTRLVFNHGGSNSNNVLHNLIN